MFGFFRAAPAAGLVEKTPLSSFVKDASSGQKKQVYKRVISKATADQKAVLGEVIRLQLKK